ncbi:MAG: hypothetical protein WCI11_00095 [Candidatus Methylumidiphilus sp.]
MDEKPAARQQTRTGLPDRFPKQWLHGCMMQLFISESSFFAAQFDQNDGTIAPWQQNLCCTALRALVIAVGTPQKAELNRLFIYAGTGHRTPTHY